MGTVYYICGCCVHTDEFSNKVIGVQPCEIHGKEPAIQGLMDQLADKIREKQEERLARTKEK